MYALSTLIFILSLINICYPYLIFIKHVKKLVITTTNTEILKRKQWYTQSRISRTPYPLIGGGTLSQGPKIQSRLHLTRKETFDPQIEIWSTINQWSWGAFWKKSAYILQLLWAPWKLDIYTSQLLLRVPLKAK